MLVLSFTTRRAVSRALTGLGLLATMAISACTIPTQPDISLPRVAPTAIPITASRAMYARSPELRSCNRYQSAYIQAGWPMGDNLETVKKIDRMVRARFTYQSEEGDSWDSHPDHLLFESDNFEGDCDDLAATVLAMSLCAGVPREKLGFVITSSDWDDLGAISDHILGFYKDDSGDFHSIGDTKRRTSPLNHNLDRVSHWQYLDEPAMWNKNEPGTDVKIHVSERVGHMSVPAHFSPLHIHSGI